MPLALLPQSPGPLSAIAPELESARAFAAASKADETRRAYAREWQTFVAWCSTKGCAFLPAEPATLAAYLAALADGSASRRPRKPAGIDLALAAVTGAHKAAGFPSPREAAEVRAVRAGIRRTLGTAPRQVAPFLVGELRRALLELPDTTLGRRDRALLLVGWAGAFRRSALVSLDVADLVFDAEGVAVTVRRDKTDPEARGRLVALPFGSSAEVCPVRSLRAWLEVAGIAEGSVFRRVDRHGRVLPERLSPEAVAIVVKRAAARITLDAAAFAGHSLRAGFATTAARAGRPDRDIMRQTGHRSRTMLDRYVREAEVWRDNPAAGLL
jgi:integrase